MGEIRVKSENLFDVTTVTNVYLDAQGVEHSSEVSRTSDYIPVTANTLYTLGMTGGSSSLNLTAYCFYDSNKEFLSSGTYQPSTNGNIVSITTPNNCAYFRFTYSYLRNLVEFVSGVYNTFPLYFLTLPSHQKTSTGWKDIPTHTMTATGWQGELTSQSPLKFRADGAMLDWRVEGRTSGNLFDIGKTINDYERAYTIISVDGSSISMKYEASGMTFHYRTHNITTTGTVTIYCKGSKATPKLFVRLRSMDDTKWLTNSDVTISGMAYNNVYNGWYSYGGSDTFIKTIIIPECLYWNMGVGFNTGTIGEIVTISNPMVISGAYTSTTIPEYEAYGGVGDWDETAQRYKIPVTVNGITTNLYTDHQLMEGDSIDYAITETQIPIATGNNILTVDTAVQPDKVFIKFEG